MDNKNLKDSTKIVNYVHDQAQDMIEKTTDETRKLGKSSIESINACQDQDTKMAQDFLDASIVSQKNMLDLFKRFLNVNPFIDSSLVALYRSGIERTGEMYAKLLVATLQNNVSALRVSNNTNSANIGVLNTYLDNLKYVTRQSSNAIVNTIANAVVQKRVDQTIPENEKNVMKIEKYILAEFPKQISIRDPGKLILTLQDRSPVLSSILSSPSIQGGGKIGINVAQGSREVRLLAYFNQENSSFDLLEKEYCKEIVVPIDPINDEKSKPKIEFNLMPKREGYAYITLHLFKEGVGGYIGELTLNSHILGAAKTTAQSVDYPKFFGSVKIGKFVDDLSAPYPDVTLYILQTKSDPTHSEYQAYLASQEIGYSHVGTISLSQDVTEKFRALFKEIEKTNMSPTVIDEKIRAIGLSLYDEIVPLELKAVYWRIRDTIQSIQVWSMEPWIPWEIIKPSRILESGAPEEDNFLCESFACCRWRIGIPPVVKDRLRKIRVVVPSDTKLKSALDERDWIKEFARNNGISVSSVSSLQEVLSTFRSGDFDILHFCTHGKNNKDLSILSRIELENGEELTPAHISGMATTFGQSHPIVILNACQSGAQDFSFTEIQGWSTRFLNAGASAFICTLWSITDEAALNFTKELYNQLLNGVSLGEAVTASRLKCRKIGDASWLAYELYGHPNMKVTFGNRQYIDGS